ncbi:RNA polymerase sigma-70 factor [Fulvivirgaceae bacterium BMA10]|uniref:RNA polymerase sigma-70 factor n=1 Tax=Splendidivirga corallicola TaxID=3051826 RepID=A0ABT8KUB1_9BACT|nr:RNA polymerase sigma-70 factor [Fulvivirgaceae bacterium BMA10]
MSEKNEYIDFLIRGISLRNDQSSLKELVHYFYPRLYRIAYAILKNKMLAEEVINDVFFRLWQMRHRCTDIKDLNKYLCTSAKNNAIVLLKKEMKRNPNNLEFIDDIFLDRVESLTVSVSPEKQYLTEELKSQIESAIQNLPERCRVIFQLVKLEGLSYKEAAVKLSIKPKTVENQLAIALKKMHEELKPYLLEPSDYHFEKTIILFLISSIISI